MTVIEIIATCFIAAGMLFCLASVIGYVRLPDFYSRCHASGLSETLALLLTCVGLIIYCGLNMTSVKLALLLLIVCICNPIGSHAICNAAVKSGLAMTTTDTNNDTKEEEVDAHADSAD